jgi:hypothetical protein
VLFELALLAACLGLGVAAQRHFGTERSRRRAWNAFFFTLSPAVVFYAFTSVPVDRATGLALAAAVLGSWLTLAAAFAYARAVGRDRRERGALTLAAGFGNTGFLGYPLAHLAFGPAGLALMAVYDRLAFLVPGTAVTTTIARMHGEPGAASARLRAALLNPPLWAAAAAAGLRAAGVDATAVADPLGVVGGLTIGPVGFFLLGLNIPLEPVRHGRDDVRRALGALAIRFAGGPLLLLAAGLALRVDVPTPFLLGAAMPTAFNAMILARVFDLRPRLVRLLVVGSTVPAVVAVCAATALR